MSPTESWEQDGRRKWRSLKSALSSTKENVQTKSDIFTGNGFQRDIICWMVLHLFIYLFMLPKLRKFLTQGQVCSKYDEF